MDFDVSFTTGNKKLIYSGIIILEKDEKCISFIVKSVEKKDDDLKVEFIFENDGGKKNILGEVKGKGTDDERLIIKCINFIDGTCTLKPIEVGYFTKEGRNTYISFQFWYSLSEGKTKKIRV